MREAGKVTGQILRDLEGLMRPGVATIEIDRFVERAVKAAGMSASEKDTADIQPAYVFLSTKK